MQPDCLYSLLHAACRVKDIEGLRAALRQAKKYRPQAMAAEKELELQRLRFNALKEARIATEAEAVRLAEQRAAAAEAAVEDANRRATAAETAARQRPAHTAAAEQCRGLRRELQDERARSEAERDALQVECRRLQEQLAQVGSQLHAAQQQLQRQQERAPGEHLAAPAACNHQPKQQPVQPNQADPRQLPQTSGGGDGSTDTVNAVCSAGEASPPAGRQMLSCQHADRTPTSRHRRPPRTTEQMSMSPACCTLPMRTVLEQAAQTQPQTPVPMVVPTSLWRNASRGSTAAAPPAAAVTLIGPQQQLQQRVTKLPGKGWKQRQRAKPRSPSHSPAQPANQVCSHTSCKLSKQSCGGRVAVS